MDAMDYWAIAERDIEIQNPVTDRKLRLLNDYCDVRAGLRVIDAGCGKAWIMRQWADKHDITGVGLELNPHFVRFAREAATARGTAGKLEFVEGPALDYKFEVGSFDVGICLGATFALGGFVATLDWLATAVRPGGTIVVGDITLRHRPPHPIDERLPHDALDTIGVVERHGAEVSATISASEADFERYISHHRHSTLAWARENPQHPDHADVLKRSRDEWRYYLRVVRPYLGWTIYTARRRD